MPPEAGVVEPPKPATTPTSPTPPAKPGETGASIFSERFTGKAKKPDAPKKPDEAQPGAAEPAAPGTPATPAAAPTPPKAKKPTPTAPAQPKVDLADLPDRIAEGVAKGIAAAQPKPAKPDEEFTSDQKEIIAVLERMGKEYPEEVGKKDEFVKALRRAKEYQTKWESDHPGESFDPEDEQHAEFFDGNEVTWEDHRYYKALAKIEAEALDEKSSSKTKEKLSEIERKEKLREAAPKIVARQAETAKSFFASLGDDYKNVLREDGSLNGEEIKRLREADPVRAIVFQAAQGVEEFAGALHMLVEGLVDFSENDPMHAEVARFIAREEELMMTLPPEQRQYNGREFVTAEEYEKIPKEKRSRYWKYSERDLARIHAERVADYVKEAVENENKRLEQIATARGWKPKPGEPAAPKPPETPNPEPARQPSPSPTMEPRPAPSGAGGAGGANSATSSFLARFKS